MLIIETLKTKLNKLVFEWSFDVDDNIKLIRSKQIEKLQSITNNILSTDNLLKLTIANPKEIDPHIFNGFAEVSIHNSYNVNEFSNGQNTIDNRNLIKLYIGEEPTTDCYYNFFKDNNIELKGESAKIAGPENFKDAEWVFQFDEEEPTVFATQQDQPNLTITLNNTNNASIEFSNNNRRFKIWTFKELYEAVTEEELDPIEAISYNKISYLYNILNYII